MFRPSDQIAERAIANIYGSVRRENLLRRSLQGDASRGKRFLHWCHQTSGLYAKPICMILLFMPVKIWLWIYITFMRMLNPSFKMWMMAKDNQTGETRPFPYDPYAYIKVRLIHLKMKFFKDWLVSPKYLQDFAQGNIHHDK